jgi:hypothetical protein
VSTFSRCNGLAIRAFALSLVPFCLSTAIFAQGASPATGTTAAVAQAAPQLLPYKVTVVAGGGTAPIAKSAVCPVSGFTSTDAYGDGCLATEIQLAAPRYATADVNGNIFFSDYTNGLIRRIDVISGIVTAVAGGAYSSPTAGTACGAYTSADAKGDGCLATAVDVYRPTGLVFAPQPAGDLYFAEYGNSDVRKIAATNGVITTGGVISLVAGSVASTFGYSSNNPTATINAATQSYLDAPYGLSFDAAGNLYIAAEYKNAIEVVNTNTTGSTTVTGVTIPAGTIAKIVGAPSAGGSTCPNSPATTYGCTYGAYVNGAVANAAYTDSPYGVTVDPFGNVYFANEYDNSVGGVNPAGILNTYAGKNVSTGGKVLQRGPATSFAIGSTFDVASDNIGNIYITDALNGVVWRVDGGTQSMYVVAGGASTVCSSGNGDAWGDGCPATQAKFGSSGTSYATATSPGIFGVDVDSNSNLYIGDTISNLVREVSSGTQFGKVGTNPVTQIVDIHFAAGDTPAASAYSLAASPSNFSLGTASCVSNTDTTTDCQLPVTASPMNVATNMVFKDTLQVTSALGGVGSFSLSGIYFGTPVTSTSVMISNNGDRLIFLPTTPVTATATVASSGNPTGTITFFANGTQLGQPQNISGAGTATITTTFAQVGTYLITATYSGDGYFTTSTSSSPVTIVSSLPTFSLGTSPVIAPSTTCTGSNGKTVAAPCVVQGQTALFSFNLDIRVYTGTISFSCPNLPATLTCVFSPSTIIGTGTSPTPTVALSITTQQGTPPLQAGLGIFGRGPWQAFGILPGILLALWVGIRRRKSPMRFSQAWMALALLLATTGLMACGKAGTSTVAGTPAGVYNVTVVATGSTAPATPAAPLTVSFTVVQ